MPKIAIHNCGDSIFNSVFRHFCEALGASWDAQVGQGEDDGNNMKQLTVNVGDGSDRSVRKRDVANEYVGLSLVKRLR